MRKQNTLIVVLCILCLAPLLTYAAGQAEQQKKDALVPITLWYSPAVTDASSPPSDWVVYDIVREKLGIDLRLTALPASNEADQAVKLQAAAAANNLPDLSMISRDPWKKMVDQGLIVSVDDMYPLMPRRTSIQYDADSIAYTTINGKSYGLASPGAVSKNEGLVIRKDWLDKLGLDIPVTTDDLLDVMRAFTYQDPDGNGKNDTWGYGAFIEVKNYEGGFGRRLQPLYGAFGIDGTWNMTKENFGLNLRSPKHYDFMVYMKTMVDERLIDPNWMSYKKDDFRAAWKQGKFGIMREQNGAVAAEANFTVFNKNFPDGKWIVIDPPVGPYGDSSVGVNINAYRMYAVSQKAADAGKKEAIARLLEWMSSEEGYYLLGWGQEGINYTLDENGTPIDENLPNPKKGFLSPEGLPLTQLRNLVFYNSNAELESRYPRYTTVNGIEMSALDVLRDMQKRKWTNGMGMDTMPSPPGDVKRFWEQGIAEFLTGKRVLTKQNWAAYIADFDAMGGLQWEQAGRLYAEENGYLR